MRFLENDYLITHANCMDGAACAVAFLYFGGNRNNIRFTGPSHEKVDAVVTSLALAKDVKSDDGKIFIADVSVSQETAKILDKRNDILLFDHHKSAIPLKDYAWCNIDVENKRCGAKVFYEWCCSGRNTGSDALALLIEAIDDRDRWINRNRDSQNLSILFSLLGQDSFIERCHQFPYPHLRTNEGMLVQIEKQRKSTYISNLRPLVKQKGEHQIGFVYCESRYISDAGHHLCDKHSLDCCVLINADTISLRAPENSPLDMARIAVLYGGGGHAGAAGFSIKGLLGQPLIDTIASELRLS